MHVAHRLLCARDWQDWPQLDELCAWWRSGAGGVCALVGIGDAGKTAIADRFVRSLPDAVPSPDVAADESLTPPCGLFVFSFYDAPNADSRRSTWIRTQGYTRFELGNRLSWKTLLESHRRGQNHDRL